MLAADQINQFCKDATISKEEASEYAEVNITAARFAAAASKFDRGEFRVREHEVKAFITN